METKTANLESNSATRVLPLQPAAAANQKAGVTYKGRGYGAGTVRRGVTPAGRPYVAVRHLPSPGMRLGNKLTRVVLGAGYAQKETLRADCLQNAGALRGPGKSLVKDAAAPFVSRPIDKCP